MNNTPILLQEGSQETAATMVGMLLGMVLARLTAGNVVALWVSFLLLTTFHMYGECLLSTMGFDRCASSSELLFVAIWNLWNANRMNFAWLFM